MMIKQVLQSYKTTTQPLHIVHKWGVTSFMKSYFAFFPSQFSQGLKIRGGMQFFDEIMLFYCIVIADLLVEVAPLFTLFFTKKFLLHILHLLKNQCGLHKYFCLILFFFGEVNATLLHYHRRFTGLKLLLQSRWFLQKNPITNFRSSENSVSTS